MGLACISGAKECAGCGDCRNTRHPTCPICEADLLPDDKIYCTRLGRILGCEHCIEEETAKDVFEC